MINNIVLSKAEPKGKHKPYVPPFDSASLPVQSGIPGLERSFEAQSLSEPSSAAALYKVPLYVLIFLFALWAF